MAQIDDIKNVKRKYSADLMRLPGVCGVDIDTRKTGEAVLKLHLDTRDPKIRTKLPTSLDGFTVEYVYTGPIRKLSLGT